MRYGELSKKLRAAGCYEVDGGKRHGTWYSPVSKKRFMVGRHKTEEVPIGTLKAILRDAGLE